MINLSKIAAQTDQAGETNRQLQLAENNGEIRFIARVLENVNNLSTALKTQAETYGSPKERKICKIDVDEVLIYMQTKEKIISKIKEQFGGTCSIYLSSETENKDYYIYNTGYINITWDGKDREDKLDIGFVRENKKESEINCVDDDEPTMTGFHCYMMQQKKIEMMKAIAEGRSSGFFWKA